jgi:hypothetical protein
LFRMHGVQHCTPDAWFNFPITPPNLYYRRDVFKHISDFHFITSIKHIYFYLVFWAPFTVFWAVDFHKMKGKETLSRSHMI